MAHNPQRPRVPPLSDFPPLSASSPPEQSGLLPSNGMPRLPPHANGAKPQHPRHSSEFRPHHQPNGSRNIPSGPHAPAGQRSHGHFNGPGGFDTARSPPSKNTSHVPCKFFKQGQCQAGSACPFSHSLDTSKFETPCKYFSKGNCKFGQKCALLHVLPNGRIVNRHVSGGMVALNIGNRVDPPSYQHQESALGNSLLSQQQSPAMNQAFNHQLPQMPDVSPSLPPTIHHTQPFDIPRNPNNPEAFGNLRGGDDGTVRAPRSPNLPKTSIAEVNLPASFDSNGTSYMAMYGPVAASVPAKFGYESPHSLPNAKPPGPTADALRSIQHENAYSIPPGGSRIGFNPLGSSPSSTLAEPPSGRVMHSQRYSKPRMISASLPRHTGLHPGPAGGDDYSAASEDDGGSDGGAGEEYVPNVLSHLLSPSERIRRSSGKVENPIAIRGALAGESSATPTHPSAFGSPSSVAAASPSRFSALFSKKDEPNGGGTGGFNHAVGSPFRTGASHLSPSLRPVQRPPTSGSNTGDFSPFGMSSPPRGTPSNSILSQQLKRMHLSGNDGSSPSAGAGGASPGLHPPMVSGGASVGAGRHASNPRSSYDRAVSSSSAHTNRIDEEQEFVFSLDEEEDMGSSRALWGNQKSPLGSVGDGRLKGPKP